MIDLFMPIRSFLKFQNVYTDNNIFRLHYKLTVIILLVCTLLVTSKQFFGEPIHCISEGETINKDAINSYCWIYGAFTLENQPAAKHMLYPGVGTDTTGDAKHRRHSYYQWVSFILLCQAAMFYTPHYLWKIWEGGKLKALVSDLANPLVTKNWGESRRAEMLSYLTYSNIHTHMKYALLYGFCEVLNFVNTVGQIFLLDLFLGGSFRNYGSAVATFTQVPDLPTESQQPNPMDLYFPKLTKCSYRDFGPSGTPQLKDRLCVLPLNIINEKIFAVLWFWLIILAVLSALAIFFRIIIFTVPTVRTYLIMSRVRQVDRYVVSKITNHFGYGDWFVLHLLGKNMNPIAFKDLVLELSKEIGNNKAYNV
ncbi:unnamed protein product, partial [Brenthis ino]